MYDAGGVGRVLLYYISLSGYLELWGFQSRGELSTIPLTSHKQKLIELTINDPEAAKKRDAAIREWLSAGGEEGRLVYGASIETGKKAGLKGNNARNEYVAFYLTVDNYYCPHWKLTYGKQGCETCRRENRWWMV